MENQTQATDPIANLTAKVLTALMEGVNQMVDERVERIMATQATAALFNDSLDERIRNIAMEEVTEKLGDMDDEIHDAVATQIGEFDLTDDVERAFDRVAWETKVDDRVDEVVADSVASELDNVLADKVDEVLEERLEEKFGEVLEERLEEKVREVLIKIINGE